MTVHAELRLAQEFAFIQESPDINSRILIGSVAYQQLRVESSTDLEVWDKQPGLGERGCLKDHRSKYQTCKNESHSVLLCRQGYGTRTTVMESLLRLTPLAGRSPPITSVSVTPETVSGLVPTATGVNTRFATVNVPDGALPIWK